MADWNDVTTVLNSDPAICSHTPIPGVIRAVHAVVAAEGYGELDMFFDNSANEYWLQLYVRISDSTAGDLWEAAGWLLRDLPAVGLAQHGGNLIIRHGIFLSETSIHAITNGITITAFAAASVFAAVDES